MCSPFLSSSSLWLQLLYLNAHTNAVSPLIQFNLPKYNKGFQIVHMVRNYVMLSRRCLWKKLIGDGILKFYIVMMFYF